MMCLTCIKQLMAASSFHCKMQTHMLQKFHITKKNYAISVIHRKCERVKCNSDKSTYKLQTVKTCINNERAKVEIVELCAENRQTLHNDFQDYAHK